VRSRLAHPAGIPSHTNRTPRTVTKPRRVNPGVLESTIFSVFGVKAFARLGDHGLGSALNGIDDRGVRAAAAEMW
jgi:hypothetical protein